jgi:predicted metalloprotease with PDZ domain
MVSKLKERGWVGIEMDEEDGKLAIPRVEGESPAAEAGLRQGDVLVAMNGIEFKDENQEKLYEAKKAMRVGKTVAYTVDRQGCCHIKGGKSDVEVTLASIPEEVVAKWVGGHMMDHAAIELARN